MKSHHFLNWLLGTKDWNIVDIWFFFKLTIYNLYISMNKKWLNEHNLSNACFLNLSWLFCLHRERARQNLWVKRKIIFKPQKYYWASIYNGTKALSASFEQTIKLINLKNRQARDAMGSMVQRKSVCKEVPEHEEMELGTLL